jgi:hypothetical protein
MLFGGVLLLVGWVEYVAAGWDVLVATYRQGGSKALVQERKSDFCSPHSLFW